MKRLLALIIVLLVNVSCKKETVKKVDVSNIKVEVLIDRFEQKFYNADKETLPVLKENIHIYFQPKTIVFGCIK